MSENVFFKFRDLPTELRLLIWSFCIPGPRVYEMEIPMRANHNTFPPESDDHELWSSSAGQFPVILQVCRESREVVKKAHVYYTSQYEAGMLDDPATDEDGVTCPPWVPMHANSPVRIRKGVDIVHLHWHREYDNHVWFPPAPKPWPIFRWLSNQAAAVSVSAELLLPFDNQEHTVIEEVEHFRPRARYYVVLAIVEMHMTEHEAAHAQVFGTLGEEPIQLVDARDTARMTKFRDAWRRHRSPQEEPDVADFFSRAASDSAEAYCASVEQWRQNLEKVWIWSKSVVLEIGIDLRNAVWPDPNRPTGYHWAYLDCIAQGFDREHPWVQEQLALMPRFEPVVMFRHCRYFSCGLPSVPRLEC